MSLRGEVFPAPLRAEEPHERCQGVKQDHREGESPTGQWLVSLLSARAEPREALGGWDGSGTHCLDPAMPLQERASGAWRAKHR